MLVLLGESSGAPLVRVLPITHTRPLELDDAIEIPGPVKQRLRLDDERSWIVLTESNRFVWPGPDLRPVDSDSGYFGAIPASLFAEVKRRFVALARGQAHRGVPRTK